MKYLFPILLFSLAANAEIFLECKPTKTSAQKVQNTSDFLVIMVEENYSNFFNKVLGRGVYRYRNYNGEFSIDSRGQIHQENIIYWSENIKLKKSYNIDRVVVSRKNLEAKVHKRKYLGGYAKEGKLKGICELHSEKVFKEIILTLRESKQSENLF